MIKEEVKAMLNDERDKMYKARNLILANVPEPDANDLDVEVGKAGDLNYVTDLQPPT